MKHSRIVAALFGAVLAALGAADSDAQVAAGVTVGWGWPGYGYHAPYRYGPYGYGYGWAGAWAPCAVGACFDSPYARRAIQRELAQLEHLRELEERTRQGFPSAATPMLGVRRDLLPPTPEAHVQPAFRGSGEVRPEFSGTGQPRQDAAAPPR